MSEFHLTDSNQDHRDYPQIAYEAYGDYVGWVSYNNEHMPTWQNLPQRIRDAWESAALAVRKAVLDKEDNDFYD